jgi:hypothetical protein
MNSDILNIHTKKILNKKSISNFEFSFNEIKNIIKINLLSLEIPKTIYYFTNKRDNNNFYIIIGATQYDFVLSEGNHTPTSIVSEINNFLLTIPSTPITITFNPNNNIIIFNSTTQFSIYFENSTIYPQLGKLLGFEENEYENINSLQNNSNIIVDTDKYFLLYLNGFGNLKFENNTYFCKLVSNRLSFTLNYVDRGNIDKKYTFKQPVNLDKFHIRILDEFGNDIDFNGIDISLSLEIKYINNSYLKKYYENFQYDIELSNKILYDYQLKYFYNKSKKIKIEDNEEIINSLVKSPGVVLLKMLSDYKDTSLDKKDTQPKPLENNPILSANQIAIQKYKEKIKEEQNKINEISNIKNKFIY